MVFCDAPEVGDMKMSKIYDLPDLLIDQDVSEKLDISNKQSSIADEIFERYWLKTILEYPNDMQTYILQEYQ